MAEQGGISAALETMRELRAEVARLTAERNALASDGLKAMSILARLERERDVFRSAFRRYGRHESLCSLMMYWDKCTCGFSAEMER